jgi:hypothetical protein
LQTEVFLPESPKESPINSALRQFEATEANLEKLERLWTEIKQLIPEGLSFGTNPMYDERVRAYREVLLALPKIEGWKPVSLPLDLDDIGRNRFDAKEVGELEAEVIVEREIEAPGRELAEYRHQLVKKRRQLIRSAMGDLIAAVDNTLRVLHEKIPADAPTNEKIADPDWDKLKDQVRAIEMLLGSALPRPAGWGSLGRHLFFGMVQDLRDIIKSDWPSSRTGLTKGLYDENEPVPVDVEDLASLASTAPRGVVSTKLKWESLDDEGFERLMFMLISNTPGYENPAWLTQTNAPDRGRDLSVTRVFNDPLGGTFRSRVIIQCKHWLKKSISVTEVSTLKEQMALWDPKVDVLVIATTGRFTADAIAAIEKNNLGDRALRIEMWPESHLEQLLAERPALIGQFRLR